MVFGLMVVYFLMLESKCWDEYFCREILNCVLSGQFWQDFHWLISNELQLREVIGNTSIIWGKNKNVLKLVGTVDYDKCSVAWCDPRIRTTTVCTLRSPWSIVGRPQRLLAIGHSSRWKRPNISAEHHSRAVRTAPHVHVHRLLGPQHGQYIWCSFGHPHPAYAACIGNMSSLPHAHTARRLLWPFAIRRHRIRHQPHRQWRQSRSSNCEQSNWSQSRIHCCPSNQQTLSQPRHTIQKFEFTRRRSPTAENRTAITIAATSVEITTSQHFKIATNNREIISAIDSWQTIAISASLAQTCPHGQSESEIGAKLNWCYRENRCHRFDHQHQRRFQQSHHRCGQLRWSDSLSASAQRCIRPHWSQCHHHTHCRTIQRECGQFISRANGPDHQRTSSRVDSHRFGEQPRHCHRARSTRCDVGCDHIKGVEFCEKHRAHCRWQKWRSLQLCLLQAHIQESILLSEACQATHQSTVHWRWGGGGGHRHQIHTQRREKRQSDEGIEARSTATGHERTILSMQNVRQQISQLLFRAQTSENVPCQWGELKFYGCRCCCCWCCSGHFFNDHINFIIRVTSNLKIE